MNSLSQQLLIGQALKYAAHYNPNKEAFVYQEKRVTYQQLLNRATHLAGWLQKQGVKKDTKVGFLLKNSLALVEVYFGIGLTEGVCVPVNFRLVPSEIEYIVNNSDIQILFIDFEYIEIIQSIRGKLPKVETIIVVEANQELKKFEMVDYESIFEMPVNYLPSKTQNDNDAHVIVYTSGTTGRPKGAVLTHKNIYMQSLNRMASLKKNQYIKVLIVPPLFHIAALTLLVTICLQEGTGVVHREFQPENILRTIQNEKIEYLFLVPAMWNFLLHSPNLMEFDISTMKKCATGGAICPLELKKKILKVFYNAELYESFGQTESLQVTYLDPKDSLRKTSSVGKASVNVRIRIVDNEMNDVPIGDIGEIVYQGPTIMKEYYKNPKATKEAFKGGWFHSGDLVRMDEEGFIYIIDRKKDMIISGGENIYPAELEEVLYSHPDIIEAAVVGIPDPEWGESVKAYIVTRNNNLNEEEVIEYCQTKLASYKKPRFVEFLEALPRNASGKVLKVLLRQNKQQKNLI
ncbi:class I adenylate-forming enzyme family protein [Gottfriedia acidiceleris]|uniref:class I adenylate-forming enzyme family protein n=1 Tax=Gottfriedia acidiceleris TaxID=371036 RepID=UPI003D259C20